MATGGPIVLCFSWELWQLWAGPCDDVQLVWWCALDAGEVDGKDYHFTTKENMEQDIAAGQFLESAQVHGNLYGTSKAAVQDTLAAGKVALLDVGECQVRLLISWSSYMHACAWQLIASVAVQTCEGPLTVVSVGVLVHADANGQQAVQRHGYQQVEARSCRRVL